MIPTFMSVENLVIKIMRGEYMNPKKNVEGYADPTAYEGTRNVIREETELDKKNHKVIQVIRLVADLAGFEIIGRITLKHKKSGKMFY